MSTAAIRTIHDLSQPLQPSREQRVDRFLFNLDGTVTRQGILAEVARQTGLERELQAITSQTMPFQASMRRQAAVLAHVPLSRVRAIVERIELDPAVVRFVSDNRDRCTVVSGHLDAWISGLVARLGVPGRCSKARVEDDRVVEVSSVLDKASVASEYSGRLCAIGNDYDDLPLLSAAEIGIAYGAAHASADCLLDIATHAIYDPTRLCRLLSAW